MQLVTMLEKIGKSMFALGLLFSLITFAWGVITNESPMAATILEVAGIFLMLAGIVVYLVSIVIEPSRKTQPAPVTIAQDEEKKE